VAIGRTEATPIGRTTPSCPATAAASEGNSSVDVPLD